MKKTEIQNERQSERQKERKQERDENIKTDIEADIDSASSSEDRTDTTHMKEENTTDDKGTPPVELLAPAGGREAFLAALDQGADAIYLGLDRFSARASADNFDEEGAKEAISYAHSRGVRVYVTLNTLVKNQEMVRLIDSLQTLSDLGADAVIVQDLGLVYLARTFFPWLELHASTQMTVTSRLAIDYLADLSFKKVVVARENSLEDIKSMAGRGTDLEVFVHGALCISYSGQCLMSSMIGGRSGNRGRCAQPCRLTYQLEDQGGRAVASVGDHLLSPKDLYGLDLLEALLAAGAQSLKIEGRMKRPEYVATVVGLYRKRLDDILAKRRPAKGSPEDLEEKRKDKQTLAQIFSRDFSSAYLEGNQGSDLMSYQRPNNRGLALGRIKDSQEGGFTMVLKDDLRRGDGLEIWISVGGRKGFNVKEIQVAGQPREEALAGELAFIAYGGRTFPGDRVFKSKDRALLEKAQDTYQDKTMTSAKRPLNIRISGRLGKPLTMEVHLEGQVFRGQSDSLLEAARKRSLDRDILSSKMRFGSTPFEVRELSIDLSTGLMLPIREVNQLRQSLAAQAQAFVEAARPRGQEEALAFYASLKGQEKKRATKTRLAVEVEDDAAAVAAFSAGADLVYVHLNKQKKNKAKNEAKDKTKDRVKNEATASFAGPCYGLLPRIIKEGEVEFWRKKVQQTKDHYDGFMAPSLDAIQLLKEERVDIIWGDYSLNVMNDLSARQLEEAGLKEICLSPELSLAEIGAFSRPAHLELLVHGNFPLMTSAHCVVGALEGGKTLEKACSAPCRSKDYRLRDRKDYLLPLLCLNDCTSQVYNARELCALEEVAALKDMGIARIRLAMRERSPEDIHMVIRAYRQVLDGDLAEDKLKSMRRDLAKKSPYGFTKGHYFREVE